MRIEWNMGAVMGMVIIGTVVGFVCWRHHVQASRKRVRDAIMLAFVSGAFGVSLTLLAQIGGTGSPVFAGIVIFVIMGWTGFAHPMMNFGVPRASRFVSARELGMTSSNWSGVPAFGALLKGTPLKRLSPAVYLRRFPRDPVGVARHLEAAEAVHLWAIVFSVPYLAYLGVNGFRGAVGVSLGCHVIGNFYPILHLRQARGRLAGYLGKKAARKMRERSPAPGIDLDYS